MSVDIHSVTKGGLVIFRTTDEWVSVDRNEIRITMAVALRRGTTRVGKNIVDYSDMRRVHEFLIEEIQRRVKAQGAIR
jgi:hypothetical protein